MLCIRATGHFKPDDPEQPPSGAKSQLALAAQFMNVKPRTLHVAALAGADVSGGRPLFAVSQAGGIGPACLTLDSRGWARRSL
jgi:hypothetical protein